MKFVLTCILVIFYIQPIFSLNFTLEDVLTRVKTDNLELQSIRNDIESASNQKYATVSNLFPSLSYYMDRQYNDLRGIRKITSSEQLGIKVSVNDLVVRPQNSYNLKLQLVQPIIDFSLFDEISRKHKEREWQKARLKAVENDLMIEATNAFYNILKSKVTKRMLKNKIAILTDAIREQEFKLSTDLITREQLFKIKVERLTAAQKLRDHTQRIVMNTMSLNKLMNRPLHETLEVLDDTSISFDYYDALDFVGLVDRLIQQDPQLKQMVLEKAILESEYSLHKFTRYPKAYFDTSYGYTNNVSYSTDRKLSDYSWRVYLTVPLFHGFKGLYEREGVKEKLRAIDHMYLDKKREQELVLTELVFSIENLLAEHETSTGKVQLYLERLNIMKEKQRLNQVTDTDVSLSRMQLREQEAENKALVLDLKSKKIVLDILLDRDIQF